MQDALPFPLCSRCLASQKGGGRERRQTKRSKIGMWCEGVKWRKQVALTSRVCVCVKCQVSLGHRYYSSLLLAPPSLDCIGQISV